MKKMQKIMKTVFCLFLLIGLLPLAPQAAEASQNSTVLIAASDFQSYANSHTTCQNQMNRIFSQIKKDYSRADGFLFAGDYYHEYSVAQSELGILTMTDTVLQAGFGIDEDAIIKVQGNHDYVGTRFLSPSGNNDPDSGKYGVYVIHEDDYMWFSSTGSHNGSETVSRHKETVKQTAKKLEAYLEEKIEEKFTAPIFVLSHLPLHYSMRTYTYGDGIYARYLYDELEYAANLGLNIVFIFGHNHSHGWDHHLGGSSIYLSRGDTINIGVPDNRRACVQETLGFTYLNAGYIGYFSTDNGEPVDTTLTMTVYEITDGRLIIKRYDENGLHDLKSSNGPNWNIYDYRTEAQHGIFPVNTKTVLSSQTVDLFTQAFSYTPSTCQTQGTQGYLVTSSGKIYTDATLTHSTTVASRALPLSGHKYSYTSLGALTHRATCLYCADTFTEDHHYYSISCEDCAQSRNISVVPAKEATCSEPGNILYYWHAETQSYYLDSLGHRPTSLQQVTLPLLPHAFDGGYEATEEGHRRLCTCGEKDDLVSHDLADGVCSVCLYEESLSLTYRAAKDSTCIEQGNNAYYFDPKTGLCFQDAKGSIPTTLQKQLRPLAPHRYGDNALCTVCSQKDPDFLEPAVPSSSTVPSVSSSVPSSSVVNSVPATSTTPPTSSTSAPASSSVIPSRPVESETVPTSSQPSDTQNYTVGYVAGGLGVAAIVGTGVGIFLKKRKNKR